MATTITVCNPDIPASQFLEVELDDGQSRRQYTPSLWGEFFLTHEPCTPSELLSMKEKAEAKKEEVRRIVLDAAASDDLTQKLDLVDVLQRLGVAYHYKKEIDDVLCAVYDDKLGGSDDLYVTSLRFYLLRKHGYSVSSDVFVKFRDEEGNISSDDVNIMMMLYDAAHMRITGEDILDNIITVNKSRLQYLAETNLETDQVEEIRVTLETPRFRRVERVEARRFISAYEKNAARDDTLLEFAKLDYNIVQALYCQELKQLTTWWKDFKSRTDMRWDEKAAEQLPKSLRSFYCNVISNTNEIIEHLKIQKNMNAEAVRKLVTHVAKSYHAEVKWRDDQYIPTNVEEHLQISMPSIVAMQTANCALVSLGDVTSREAVEWAFNFPKIVRGVAIVARISNDIVSHEREQASDHMASTVQTCMKQYGVTAEEATEKLRVHVEKAWMEIVQGCLDQEYSIVLLEKVVNCARTIDFIYKREDAYTSSSKLKDTITSLYVKLV
ncbi:hypothetical protein PR202_gb25702 [Eleusine coracana subsp. coracana]|uniref:Uncharacterized protein n=1 Tax=Eleusine coracana subsp. coracana TaxID=191504 RepID=A0AAV5FP99_ELECO|nr:hypothetical protein PR202_gb25702 [Eleusine coracana subsp. coracana]